MLERNIVAAIMRYLKTVPHCFCWKTHGGMYGTAGVPDIIICLNGRFVTMEVKTPTGKLTKIQEATLNRINDAKGYAFKVTSLQEAKEIIKSFS